MQSFTIEDIEVIYESKMHAELKIKGTPEAICEVLKKLNNGNINLKTETK
jgi:hypothetical protein